VVALNRFPGDSDAEVEAVLEHCREELGIEAAESTVFEEGGAGGTDLAEKLLGAIEANDEDFEYLYDLDSSIEEKIETIATEIYGAESVSFQSSAQDDIERMNRLGYDEVPVVMSKTFHSLSDDAAKKGVPTGWNLEIQEIYPSAGAGFLVALTSDVLTLPGLPADPAAAGMDIDPDGTVSGLF
jgi:formate--tetrahydrofolate ligase